MSICDAIMFGGRLDSSRRGRLKVGGWLPSVVRRTISQSREFDPHHTQNVGAMESLNERFLRWEFVRTIIHALLTP